MTYLPAFPDPPVNTIRFPRLGSSFSWSVIVTDATATYVSNITGTAP